MRSVHPVEMEDLDSTVIFCVDVSESQSQRASRLYPLGKSVIALLASFRGINFKGKNPDADFTKDLDEDLQNDETLEYVDKGHVTIREKFQLTKSDENRKDQKDDGVVFDLRVSTAREVRRGNFSILDEWSPVPVHKRPTLVLLKAPELFNVHYLWASEKGTPEMRPINLNDQRPALFEKRDYIVKGNQYGSTFINPLRRGQLSVNENLQVRLDKVDGDPRSSRHPGLFFLTNTSTTQIRPSVAPDKYLGYENNRVVITDKVMSFHIFPAKTVGHPTEDLENALNSITSNTTDLDIDNPGLRIDPAASGNSNLDIDHYISRNGAWPSHRAVDAVLLRHSWATHRSYSQ